MTKGERLLELLGDYRAHDMRELIDAGGFRYGGRLKELRDAGHAIETICVKHPNHFAYRLLPREPKQLELLS